MADNVFVLRWAEFEVSYNEDSALFGLKMTGHYSDGVSVKKQVTVTTGIAPSGIASEMADIIEANDAAANA